MNGPASGASPSFVVLGPRDVLPAAEKDELENDELLAFRDVAEGVDEVELCGPSIAVVEGRQILVRQEFLERRISPDGRHQAGAGVVAAADGDLLVGLVSDKDRFIQADQEALAAFFDRLEGPLFDVEAPRVFFVTHKTSWWDRGE